MKKSRRLSLFVTAVPGTALLLACGPSSEAPRSQSVAVTRLAGSWQGTGNRTIDLVSDSGRFHITWEARNEHPPNTGRFRLTVHSAVSGRPIQVVADHRGEGSGSADFADDPRVYNFVVDSTNVEWAFSVNEIIAAPVRRP